VALLLHLTREKEANMAENEKPDFAPKEYKMPNLDFSDTDIGRQQAAKAATEVKTHVVEKGENLSVIAEQELGSANRWREIYELNIDVIGSNPDLIQPGQELRLPS
jgi:nucleoid-associated protein YgaU